MSTIAENIANIRAQMAEAAKKAGRDPSEILLCAATKMNDAERVKEAVAAGVDCCGENRVQELQAKRPLGAYTGKPLHFIGHLQTNKVKYLVGVVDLIESVDRLELLECIEKQAEKLGVVQNILFEVNIGNEESKSGFTPAEAAALAAFTEALDPALVLAYHTQGNVIYWKYLNFEPEGSRALAARFAAVSGYACEDTPYASGFAGYKDWFIQNFDRPGYTIECGLGENPLPLSQFESIWNANLGILTLAALGI